MWTTRGSTEFFGTFRKDGGHKSASSRAISFPAAESQLQDLLEEAGDFERLQFGKSKELVLEIVEDLPRTPIRARIATGMTQEGLALRLGLKTQQVQRYEAIEALGLRMRKPARLVLNVSRSLSIRQRP